MTPGSGPVAVLGATGRVGSAAVRMLGELGLDRLRVGARDERRLSRLPAPTGTERHVVDADDPRSLAEFCDGARLVLNCAGPSYLLLDRVAQVALEAGGDYVDVSGDGPAYRLLDGSPLFDGTRTAVLSAGMLPGLANVVPRLLADDLTGARLVVYAGGVERFSLAAAGDLVLSVDSSDDHAAHDGSGDDNGHWYGEALAGWSDGRRQRKALAACEDVEVAGFPGRVTTMPFLTADAERLARSAGLAELQWFNVFLGSHLRLALGRLRGRVSREPEALSRAIDEVLAAGELDLAGRDPFYLMAFTVSRPDRTDTALLRTPSSFDLTAATAAVAVHAVHTGSVDPGLHVADEVLDPHELVTRAAELGALPVYETHAHAHDETLEEGAL